MPRDADRNPYDAPTARDDPPDPKEARERANSIELVIGDPVPRICLKCGATNDLLTRRAEFSWVPESRGDSVLWKLLMATPFGDWVSVALRGKLRAYAKLDLSLCPRCNTRWDQVTWLQSAALYGPLLIYGGAALMGMPIHTIGVLVAVALGWAGPYLVSRIVKEHTLRPIHIDDRTARLAEVTPAARNAFEDLTRAKKPQKTKPKRRLLTEETDPAQVRTLTEEGSPDRQLASTFVSPKPPARKRKRPPNPAEAPRDEED